MNNNSVSSLDIEYKKFTKCMEYYEKVKEQNRILEDKLVESKEYIMKAEDEIISKELCSSYDKVTASLKELLNVSEYCSKAATVKAKDL